jgi:hypothetical protein
MELEPGWEEAFLEMEALFTEMGLWGLLLKEKQDGAQCG